MKIGRITKKLVKESVLVLSLLFLLTMAIYRFGSVETDLGGNFLSEDLGIVLPLDNVYVSGTQTFRVRPLLKSGADEFRWSVDGGVRSGVLGFDGINYTDSVVVDDWNWRKDNRYEVIFHAYQDGVEVASSRRVVYTIEQDLVSISTETKKVQAEPNAQLPRSKNILTGEEGDKPKPIVAGVSSAKEGKARLVWLTQEKKDWITQDVLVDIADLDARDFNVYWSVEGGHENIVNKRDEFGNPILSINFSGWWWKGEGPYPITLIFENISGERLSQIELTFRRQNGNDVILEGLDGQVDIGENTNPVQESGGILAQGGILQPDIPQNQDEVVVSDTVKKSAPLASSAKKLEDWGNVSGLYFAEKPAIESDLRQARMAGAPSEVLSALNYISSQPQSTWLNGNSYDFKLIERAMLAARLDNVIPVFVLYNIPQRDCGLYSSGGANSYEAYRSWIDQIKQATTENAVFIVEPDALAMLNCLDSDSQQRRIDAINYAVTTLSTVDNSYVYIDAGHAFWVDAKEMSKRLQLVNIKMARGFALNVSNYVRTVDTKKYGDNLSALLGGKGYVVDTSRNGQGQSPVYEWCNPWGRGLGEVPGFVFAGSHDANLWIKTPGESDGYCNGGPNAGTWWRDYAVDLYKNKI